MFSQVILEKQQEQNCSIAPLEEFYGNLNNPALTKFEGEEGLNLDMYYKQEVYNNDFIEKNILQLDNESQNQEEGNIIYDEKINQLEMGLGKMKELMSTYELQLKQIELIKNNCQVGGYSNEYIESDMGSWLMEQKEEQKIQQLKQQVMQQKKQIKKKQKVFKCQEANCSFESKKKIEVSRHIRKCHNYFGIQSQYQCSFCQQKFHIEEARIRHEKVNHKDELSQSSQVQQQESFNDTVKNVVEQEVVQKNVEDNNISESHESLQYQQDYSFQQSCVSKEELFDIEGDFVLASQ